MVVKTRAQAVNGNRRHVTFNASFLRRHGAGDMRRGGFLVATPAVFFVFNFGDFGDRLVGTVARGALQRPFGLDEAIAAEQSHRLKANE